MDPRPPFVIRSPPDEEVIPVSMMKGEYPLPFPTNYLIIRQFKIRDEPPTPPPPKEIPRLKSRTDHLFLKDQVCAINYWEPVTSRDLLACGHYLCINCQSKIEKILCPLCRAPLAGEKLSFHFLLKATDRVVREREMTVRLGSILAQIINDFLSSTRRLPNPEEQTLLDNYIRENPQVRSSREVLEAVFPDLEIEDSSSFFFLYDSSSGLNSD